MKKMEDRVFKKIRLKISENCNANYKFRINSNEGIHVFVE